MATYYFNASQSGPTDANGVWTSGANGFDGSTATTATVSVSGSNASNALEAQGTTAPTSGSPIVYVNARSFGSRGVAGATLNCEIWASGRGTLLGTTTNSANGTAWGNYVTLTAPAGGWTWSIVNSLDTVVYASGVVTGIPSIARVELEVYYSTQTGNEGSFVRVPDGMSRSEVAN